MSNQQQRLAVFPTRMSLNLVKQKEKGAVKGHTLLKRKSDALTARFRAILSKIHSAKQQAAEQLRQAAFSLTEVNFVMGSDPGFTVREAVAPGPPPFQVTARLDNVSGVALPVFEAACDEDRARAAFELTALAKGGQAIAKAREAHQAALRVLLDLASWQTAFMLLDDVIRTVNRRVNALEFVVIPKLDNTISYIAAELDEQDREEFFRLKKIQSKKQRDRPHATSDGAAGEIVNLLVDDDPIQSLF